MILYTSTRGDIAPVDFETAVLQGFAADGGLFVPEAIPQVEENVFERWASLAYVDLAFEVLSLFIDRSQIPADNLREILHNSFASFTHPEIAPVVQPDPGGNHYVMELFHGPTLSFKDVAMGFLINTMDFFLQKRNKRLSLLVATTGDTGPAAAYAAAGKQQLDCWVLFPQGMISAEQQRQMTTLEAPNVHAVGAANCRDGGDDLDRVVAALFADKAFARQVNLSSVNSINWGRVLMQAVHYIYAYLRIVDDLDEAVAFSVPTGAFGNLFGGYIARSMGLPVRSFVVANNPNAAVSRILTRGILKQQRLLQTVSSAIDIVVPYNFWRYLYFMCGADHGRLKHYMDTLTQEGRVHFDDTLRDTLRDGVISAVVSDPQTLDTMSIMYHRHGYLLDPHGAVAVTGARMAMEHLPLETKVVSLATAHPAKFPDAVRKALSCGESLPGEATHQTIRQAAERLQRLRIGDCRTLETGLRTSMAAVAGRKS